MIDVGFCALFPFLHEHLNHVVYNYYGFASLLKQIIEVTIAFYTHIHATYSAGRVGASLYLSRREEPFIGLYYVQSV